MSAPLISVVIPFYNTGKSLKKLLAKILSSDFRDIEVICIDDCSTDNSHDVISEIKDERLTICRTEINAGSAAARNLGLRIIRGKYVVFLDSDDDIADNYFEKMLGIISDKDVVLGVCGIQQKYLKANPVKTINKFISAPIERSAGSWKEYILSLMIADGRLYSSVNKIYLADTIRKKKISFDEELNFAEDTKFVLDYLGCFDASARIAFVPEALYIYNYGTATSVVASSSLSWNNWQKSYDNILKWLNHEPSKSEIKLLARLKRRFQISHALAVARSPLSIKEQKEFLNLPTLIAAKLVVKIKH